MTREAADPIPPVSPRPGSRLAVVGALLPLVFTGAAGAMIIAAPGLFEYRLETTGWPFFALVGATAASVLACTWLVFVAARGSRIPIAVALGLAAVPWLVGLAALHWETASAQDAVGHADALHRGLSMARGIAEASGAWFVGAWLASALLASLAWGFALQALAVRASGRRWWLGGIAALLAVPSLVAVVPRVVAPEHVGELGPLLLPALGALGALVVGAAAVGDDGPRGQSGALATAAALAATLAVLAGAAALFALRLRAGFAVLSSPDEIERWRLLARVGEETSTVAAIGRDGALLLLLPVVAIAGYAATRVRPSTGRLAGGAAIVLVAVLCAGADALSVRATAARLAEVTAPPWHGIDDFVPIVLPPDPLDAAPVVAVVTLDHVVTPDGASTPLADPELATRLRHARVHDNEGGWEPRGGILRRVGPEPELVLAVDSRLPTEPLRALLRAASESGAHSVRFVGVEDEGHAAETVLADMRLRSPFVAAFGRTRSSSVVLLETALERGAADTDEVLWHTTIGARAATATLRLVPRTGSGIRPVELRHRIMTDAGPIEHPAPFGAVAPGHRRTVYIALGTGATAADAALTARRIAPSHRIDETRAVVVAGDVPGHPESPPHLMGTLIGDAYGTAAVDYVGPPMTGEGTVDLRDFGHGGVGVVHRPRVSRRAITVQGSLAREVVDRVVLRHFGEVLRCYQDSFAQNPTLTGDVTVSFLIAPSGAVQTATVAESTLGHVETEQCILQAFRRWTFPAPRGGGLVIVKYPLVLLPR